MPREKLACGNGQWIDIHNRIFYVPDQVDKVYVAFGNNTPHNNPIPRGALRAAASGGCIELGDGERVAAVYQKKKSDSANLVRNYMDGSAPVKRKIIIVYDESGEFDEQALIKSNQLRISDDVVLGELIPRLVNPFGDFFTVSSAVDFVSSYRETKISDMLESLWCIPIVYMFGSSCSRAFAQEALIGMSAGRIRFSLPENDWAPAREWGKRDENKNNPDGIYFAEALSIARSGSITLSAECAQKIALLNELYEVSALWDNAVKMARLPIKLNPKSSISSDGIAEFAEYLGIGAMLDARKSGVPLRDILS